MNSATIVSWALVIHRALTARGVPADTVFIEAGLDPAKLWEPGARYAYDGMQRLWRLAVEVTGDPEFGLEAARHFQPTCLHGLGFAWFASATLRDAWAVVSRNAAMLNGQLLVDISPSAAGAWLLMSRRGKLPVPHRAAQDASIATFVALCRQSRGQGFCPMRVRLAYPRPANIDALSEAFKAPLEFDCEQWGFEAAAADLTAPLATANAALARASEETVREYLARAEPRTWRQTVSHKLLERLASGDLSAPSIARELAVTERTLLRHLKREGTSYALLLDEVRREAARRHLADPHLSLSEISFRLGFSEASNFSRAFRRWTGVTPGQYRQRVLDPA